VLSPNGAHLRNLLTPATATAVVNAFTSRCGISALYIFQLAYGIAHAFNPSPGPRISRLTECGCRLFRCALACSWLALCLQPLSRLSNSPIPIPGPPVMSAAARQASRALQSFHISSGYGLFRRMTGVGHVPSSHIGAKHQWGGQPLSVVAVPAIEIEASSDGGETWVPLPWRYAPGAPERPPRRTAPHQPRLDWQLWFAALRGRDVFYSSPWLLRLLWKLGNDAPNVQALLDLPAYRAAFPQGRPPRVFKASLYHYDFTRYPSAWAAALPGRDESEGIPGSIIIGQNKSWPWQGDVKGKRVQHAAWWSRVRVLELLPPTDMIALAQVAKSEGWAARARNKPLSLRMCVALWPWAAMGKEAELAWLRPMEAVLGGALRVTTCFVTNLARRHAGGLRSFTGWRIVCPQLIRNFNAWWPPLSSAGFLDGPMVACLAMLLLPRLFVWGIWQLRRARQTRTREMRQRMEVWREFEHEEKVAATTSVGQGDTKAKSD